MAHGVWMVCVVRCVASVAFSPYIASHPLPVALVSCTLPLASRLLHALRCMSHALRCAPRGPMSHGMRGLPPAPRRLSSVARCVLRVVSCPLHLARSHVACFLVSVARPIFHGGCRMPSRCRVTQRRRTRSASRRRSQSVAGEAKRWEQTEVRVRAWVCVRAGVCACLRSGSKRDGVVSLWAAVRAQGAFVPGRSNNRETAAACLRS